MKITTKTGDEGRSSLFDGRRLPKDDPHFEFLGDADELTSWIGLIKAESKAASGVSWEAIQRALMKIQAAAAGAESTDLSQEIRVLEKEQRALMKDVDLPRGFVLPGGSGESARLDLARTVCRRAERALVRLIREVRRENLSEALIYLNRLSDFLFAAARSADNKTG